MRYPIRYILSGVCLLIFPGMPVLAAEEPHYDRVHFRAESREEVSNDRMIAVLSVQGEGKDPATLAEQVNESMAWALQVARREKNISVSTTGYRTWPLYHKETLRAWRAAQQLRLSGSDTASMSKLIGELQGRLQVDSINFSISDASRRIVEDRLIKDALAVFQERARLIAGQLNAEGFQIVDLNVTTSGAPIHPMSRMRAAGVAMESVAPPALEAGESSLTVVVNGAIELQR